MLIYHGDRIGFLAAVTVGGRFHDAGSGYKISKRWPGAYDPSQAIKSTAATSG